jgi:tRNA 5-methylaminomethyl-2-thiouridine biosynthesis bifunctional protein
MTELTQLHNARLSWQDDGAPYSADYDDVYFSRQGGLAETHHVFLAANDLVARWRALDELLIKTDQHGAFTITELGFGTGLNFLCCWRLWEQTACQRLRLYFISCEKHPLTLAALTQAQQQWPELAPWREQLLCCYPDHSAGYHRLPLGTVTLDLYYGDALELLRQQSSPQARIDAWFLDGFTPAHNPDLWSDEILQTICQLSRPGTTLSSYSVTGRVVRALGALGFSVERRPGFGQKRQMLFAQLPLTAEGVQPKPGHVVVIGSGLAGSTVAGALAGRGVRVTVLEAAAEAAAGASGNRQAVVQMRLNRSIDSHYFLNLHSYLYALRYYHQLASTSGNALQWHPCGVLTLNSAYTHTRQHSAPDDYQHYPRQVLEYVTAADANRLTGMTLTDDAWYLPGGGWMSPAECCRALLQHPLISIKTSTTVAALEPHENNQWRLLDDSANTIMYADTVVIANSYAARNFVQAALYPVSPLRGQVSHLSSTAASESLSMVVCSERYLAPAYQGVHCAGASYIKNASSSALSAQEHEENLLKLGAISEQLGFSLASPIDGRVAFRGSSGDFVPLAGQVPDPDLPELQYGNSRYLINEAEELRLPGLYLSIGHGSHGSVSCPLLAEHLAALICAEPSPLPAALADTVDPVRFIRRQRKRDRK